MLWLWRWGLPPPLVLFGKDPHFDFLRARRILKNGFLGKRGRGGCGASTTGVPTGPFFGHSREMKPAEWMGIVLKRSLNDFLKE